MNSVITILEVEIAAGSDRHGVSSAEVRKRDFRPTPHCHGGAARGTQTQKGMR